MGTNLMLFRLFDQKTKEQQQRPKNEARKRWSFPLKRQSHANGPAERRVSMDQDLEQQEPPPPPLPVPKIVLQTATPASRSMHHVDSKQEIQEPSITAHTLGLDEAAQTVENDMPNPHTATPSAANGGHASSQDVGALENLPDTKEFSNSTASVSVANEPILMFPSEELGSTGMAPNGTPAAQEDVRTLCALFQQHCQTLSYLRQVVLGEQQYVYSVKFSISDFQTNVPLQALNTWSANSAKVCKALEKTKQVTWPHEVLEILTDIVEEVSTSSGTDVTASTGQELNIVECLCSLLDSLSEVYAKLLLWLDRDSLMNLTGQSRVTPVVPSCELLDILEKNDRKLKKFIKCVAKDLSYVARCVCQHEVNEWDKILCDQNLDWENLSIRLQTFPEQQHHVLKKRAEIVHAPDKEPSEHVVPSPSDIPTPDTEICEQRQVMSMKRRNVLSRIIRGKEPTRQSFLKDMNITARHPWNKRGEHSQLDRITITGPMLGRVSVDA